MTPSLETSSQLSSAVTPSSQASSPSLYITLALSGITIALITLLGSILKAYFQGTKKEHQETSEANSNLLAEFVGKLLRSFGNRPPPTQ